ncbi:MAG: enoyl-CoA hydratase-related protein, partial [Rhodanobacteraceae bacterium]
MFEGLQLKHWRSEIDADAIVTLTIDRADTSVNALSRAVLDELAQIVERLAINKPRAVIIHSGKSGSFVVGADLHEFEGYARDGVVHDAIRHGQRVFQDLASLPCPTVAAIHGNCLGGGTELALACTMRVATRDNATRIGLPEVQLGIHPGWGGTARLPRLIGTPEAMKMMLTGAPARASKALRLG